VFERLATYSCGVSNATPGAFSKLIVLDTPSLQALQAYDSFYANAEALKSAFGAMAGNAGAGAGGIDMFADITSAVAAAAISSTTETAFSFTIQDPTPALMLMRHLKQQQKTMCSNPYYGGLYALNEIGEPKVQGKILLSPKAELQGLAAVRADVLKTIRTDKTSPCYAVPTVQIQGTAPPAYGINAQQDPCISAFNAIDATYNAFLAALSTPNATTAQPLLSLVAQGYGLRALFGTATDARPVLGIFVGMAAAGGTQQVRKNLITALFTGDWIRYSGGVSVNAVVFRVGDQHSAVLVSDLIRYRTPLGHIKKPKGYDKDRAQAGDNLGDIH
jgi:hypothetical protein